MLRIDADVVSAVLDWPALVDAMDAAHRRPRPAIDDVLLRDEARSLLVRAAWFGDLGVGVKAVTVFPDNVSNGSGRPSVQGEFLLFDEGDGRVLAIIDGPALTSWKTAADSALGARYLARSDARTLLMVGAGTMAESLVGAHLAVRPGIETVLLWNRTPARAHDLASKLGAPGRHVEVLSDLETAVRRADIVSCATMARDPIVRGAWLRPGTHLDLVGAFKPDMREADDEALRRGRLFVDARETTVHDIGEILIPLRSGIISEADIIGDLFDLAAGVRGRDAEQDITVYKNGGGAHLDLVTARHVYEQVRKGR